jgi:hypothetical protein
MSPIQSDNSVHYASSAPSVASCCATCAAVSLHLAQRRRLTAARRCCRVLGRLPLLAEVDLLEVDAPDLHFNQDTSKFRPQLPSLTTVTISGHQPLCIMGCLGVLARWSELPTKTCLADLEMCVPECTPITIKGWGLGWMAAAIASRLHFALMLMDDDDVALYVAAVAAAACNDQLHGCEPTVMLGALVTPAGFSRLLCAPHLPSKALKIGGPPVEHGVLVTGPRLLSEHMQQLYGVAARRLHSLSIADCSMLNDQDVAALLSALPRVRRLHLGGAARLTDAALAALLGCTQLVSVRLGWATKVTASGVAVVLMLLKGLQELCLDGLQGAELSVLAPRVRQCMPEAAAALWAERMSAVGDSATWSKVAA